MYLKSEDAECAPCLIDVLGFDYTKICMRVKKYQEDECYRKSKFGQELEPSDLSDLV